MQSCIFQGGRAKTLVKNLAKHLDKNLVKNLAKKFANISQVEQSLNSGNPKRLWANALKTR